MSALTFFFLTLSFFCVCPFLLVRHSEAEVRRAVFDFHRNHVAPPLFPHSAGPQRRIVRCTDIGARWVSSPLPWPFPPCLKWENTCLLRSMEPLFRLNKESQAWFVECVSLASVFHPQMNRHILTEVMWMPVPISAGVDYVIASIIFIFIIYLRLCFWNLKKLTIVKPTHVAGPSVQCLHVSAGRLAQNTVQRPLPRLWRCRFLSNLDLRMLAGLMAQHVLKSAIVHRVKLEPSNSQGCQQKSKDLKESEFEKVL